MDKVNFKNGQAPYISDVNLNKMQDNVENEINQVKNGIENEIRCALPIGSIVSWTTDTAPTNWLICNGQAVSRTDYEELFNVLSTRYGVGDESTTFNLPNYKGRIGVGKDENDSSFNEIGKTGGEKMHTLTVGEMPRHNHISPIDGGTETGDKFVYGGYGEDSRPWVGTSFTGESQPHNNVQPYIVMNYIIKAK